jgi:hypothetical protein
MTDRREGERRQFIDPKFLAQTVVTIALSAASAFYASYIGTQTKTAVLERAVAGVETSVTDLVREQATLTATINKASIDSARETARLQSDVAAREREIDETKAEMKRADKELFDAIKLQELRVDGIGRSIARIEGEMNAERKGRGERQ